MTASKSLKVTAPEICLRFRNWLLLLPALLIALPANSSELSAILATSRVEPPSSVAFQEERHNPMFEQPLVVEGYLEYVGEGVLRKVIESPFEETLSIEAGELVITRDGKTHKLPVRRNKSLEALLGAFEALLSGDVTRLEAVFDHEVSGDASNWTIDLTPKSRRVGKHLSSVQVSGDSRGVGKLLIHLDDGEWHVMSIQHEVPGS